MFSKTSAATAENVPREERRRGKTQVMRLEVVVESVGWTPNWTRRNWFEPRNVVLECWAGEAVTLGYQSLKCFAMWNPKDAHVLFPAL